MEYYSPLKRKEIVIQDITWMNPDDIMLSEISQLQKDGYCMIHLDEVPGQVYRIREQKGACVGTQGRENGESLVNGTEIQFCKMEKEDGWYQLHPISSMTHRRLPWGHRSLGFLHSFRV